MHQQTPVAREDRTLFLVRNGDKLHIDRLVVVEHIDTEDAETPHELAEMTVSDEAPEIAALQRLRDGGWKSGDVNKRAALI